MNCIIGIDVGKTGGVAIKYEDQYKVHPMPELKELDALLKYYQEVSTDMLVVVEDVRMWKSDADSPGKSFMIQKMLDQFAQIKAVLEIADIKYKLVAPSTWQSYLNLRPPGWKKLDKTQRKRIYQEFAKFNFPTKVNLSVADSVCILIYAIRNLKYNSEW